MRIGPYTIDPPVILAPMAGVTDRPFRTLCRRLGAGLVISEMTTSDPTLLHTEKSRLRRDHQGEQEPISVQIAGSDPAEHGRVRAFQRGARRADHRHQHGLPGEESVSSGCRLGTAARSASWCASICSAVVAAVAVPVTLKIRTGYTRAARNGIEIARIAEDCGIAALSVHGRTREDRYEGEAEYETVATIKQTVKIPVIVNGDIRTPQQARDILSRTQGDAIMIGRAAQGRPWIFREVAHFLKTGETLAQPSRAQIGAWLLGHLDELYPFYGEGKGVRIARKHIQWYCQDHPGSEAFWASVNQLTDAAAQRAHVADFFGIAISRTRGDIAA